LVTLDQIWLHRSPQGFLFVASVTKFGNTIPHSVTKGPLMAKPGRLKEIAEEYGQPLDVLIPRVISEEGSIIRAAMKLGVNTNTLQNWIRANGYSLKTRQVASLEKAPANAAV
jgi:hypothetical protein